MCGAELTPLPHGVQRVARLLQDPHRVFKLWPQDLERLTGAPLADVVQGSADA